MSLKPFTYPLPETRFLHAGRHVYKFKIRYGNFNSSPNLSLTESAAKELEEVIRVILGNLDDLHPFSTDHFTVFPYLSKWERVSKMKFQYENVHLMPYPYICTLYLELNSFQQNISCGKEVNKGSDELVRKRNEMSESTAMKEAVKRRKVEIRDDTSCPPSCMDRTGADCVHHMSKAEQGYEKVISLDSEKQYDSWPTLRQVLLVLTNVGRHVMSTFQNSSKANELEFSPASVTKDCNQLSFWEPVEFALEQKRAASQAEGAVQLLQQVDQTGKKGNIKSEGRGLSHFWRRY